MKKKIYVLQSTSKNYSKIIVHEELDKKDKDRLKKVRIKRANKQAFRGHNRLKRRVKLFY